MTFGWGRGASLSAAAFWDHALPPSERWPEVMDDNLEALHDDPTVDDAEKFKVVENAQAIHWLDEDLSEYDRSYLMQLWQTRCEAALATFMRSIASHMPSSLEQIDWYPVGGGLPRTLWRWKFDRQMRDGVSEVKRIHNYLSWDGCGQGDPDPIAVLVGQEWEYYKHPKRRRQWTID